MYIFNILKEKNLVFMSIAKKDIIIKEMKIMTIYEKMFNPPLSSNKNISYQTSKYFHMIILGSEPEGRLTLLCTADQCKYILQDNFTIYIKSLKMCMPFL